MKDFKKYLEIIQETNMMNNARTVDALQAYLRNKQDIDNQKKIQRAIY